MLETLLIAALGAIFFGTTKKAKEAERRAYHDGKCRRCGSKLRLFDYDSQGGRGYICDRCGYSTWCSYDVDGRGFL